MNPWTTKAVVLVSSVMMIVIRAPHGQRSRGLNVVKNRKGRLETGLLTFAWFAFLLPLVWNATPLLVFADYSLRHGPFIAGVLCLALRLWLFHRSHAALGTNWSVTLEVREKHQLVTHGIYRHVRHPKPGWAPCSIAMVAAVVIDSSRPVFTHLIGWVTNSAFCGSYRSIVILNFPEADFLGALTMVTSTGCRYY